MKKILNKKGFTLIELLAVIVVLGIVMVIATRSIISEMNKSNGKAAIVQGEALRREVNNACMINGTVTVGEITDLVNQDKIFSESTSTNKIGAEAGNSYFTIGLKGTKFNTVISPAQTSSDKVQILKDISTTSTPNYQLDEDRSTVTAGRLRIYIDCDIK